MTRLYDRLAKVTIIFEGGDTKAIAGLRIQFRVNKNVEKNTFSIIITNLAEETRNRIRNQGDKLILEVGYSGLPTGPGFLGVLAIGDIKFVDSQKQGPEWITEINSGDGDKAKKLAQLNESFSPGTTIGQIIEKAKGKIDELLGGIGGSENQSILFSILESLRNATSEPEVEGGETDAIVQFGMTVQGSAAKLLDEVTKTFGLEWSVQNNVVSINRVAADNGKPFILLKPTTGLIGSPTRGEKGLVKMRTLILPGIDPGRRLRLQSSIEGDYKAIRIDFDGDTHGQNWYADIEAIPL